MLRFTQPQARALRSCQHTARTLGAFFEQHLNRALSLDSDEEMYIWMERTHKAAVAALRFLPYPCSLVLTRAR